MFPLNNKNSVMLSKVHGNNSDIIAQRQRNFCRVLYFLVRSTGDNNALYQITYIVNCFGCIGVKVYFWKSYTITVVCLSIWSFSFFLCHSFLFSVILKQEFQCKQKLTANERVFKPQNNNLLYCSLPVLRCIGCICLLISDVLPLFLPANPVNNTLPVPSCLHSFLHCIFGSIHCCNTGWTSNMSAFVPLQE